MYKSDNKTFFGQAFIYNKITADNVLVAIILCLLLLKLIPKPASRQLYLLLSVEGIISITPMPVLAVVDDDPIFHFIVTRLNLRFSTFSNILSYKNGPEFISYLKHNGHSAALLPDSVLVDVYMPELSGWTVLDKLADIYNTLSKEISVFVVSNSINKSDQLRAEQYEFVESYIVKPLTEAFFVSASYIAG